MSLYNIKYFQSSKYNSNHYNESDDSE